MSVTAYEARVPVRAIDAIYSGQARRGRSSFDMAKHFEFSTTALESYAFALWEPVIYDAMVVAASVEYADRTFARPKLGWGRAFTVRIPVLEPKRWLDSAVYSALKDAVSFLTGDDWTSNSYRGRARRPVRRRTVFTSTSRLTPLWPTVTAWIRVPLLGWSLSRVASSCA